MTHETDMKLLYIARVTDLQYLCKKRDLTSRLYSEKELNNMELSELKMLRLSLHELLYDLPGCW